MLLNDRIYLMDALQGLSQLADDSVDLVVTDPPYNIASTNRSTIQRGKIVSTMRAWGVWDSFHPFDYDLLIMQVLSQCYRVLKPGGGVYMCTAREDNGYFIRQAMQRGFIYRNQIALIRKSPLPSFSKANWRSAFDMVLYVTKGKPKVFNFLSQQACVNLFYYATSHKATRHPTEKPVEFIKRLISVSSNEGDVVLDPFMGSGTTAVACKVLNRQFIGFDTSAEYLAMAADRLKRA